MESVKCTSAFNAFHFAGGSLSFLSASIEIGIMGTQNLQHNVVYTICFLIHAKFHGVCDKGYGFISKFLLTWIKVDTLLSGVCFIISTFVWTVFWIIGCIILALVSVLSPSWLQLVSQTFFFYFGLASPFLLFGV